VDAGRTAVTFRTDLFLETPTQAATQSLLLDASRAVDAVVRRHHLRAPVKVAPQQARLTSATSVLATLDRVTNAPVDLRLAISHDGTLDIWDLATGRPHIDVATGPDNPDFSQPLLRLGEEALFASNDGPRLIGSDGRSHRIGLPQPAEYFPAGDGSLWVASNGTWTHVDASGHRTGRTYRTPVGYSDGAMAAAGSTVILAENSPEAGTQAAIWTPSSGRLVPVAGACDGAVTGARDAVAFVGCDQLTLGVMNVKTGRVRTVRTPPGTRVDEAGMALSPDGTRLAFQASPLNGIDTNGSLMLFDATTGRVDVIARATIPLSWSPDGSTLLVSRDVGENLYTVPFGYWKQGMSQPEPIRIPLAGQSESALFLS